MKFIAAGANDQRNAAAKYNAKQVSVSNLTPYWVPCHAITDVVWVLRNPPKPARFCSDEPPSTRHVPEPQKRMPKRPQSCVLRDLVCEEISQGAQLRTKEYAVVASSPVLPLSVAMSLNRKFVPPSRRKARHGRVKRAREV